MTQQKKIDTTATISEGQTLHKAAQPIVATESIYNGNAKWLAVFEPVKFSAMDKRITRGVKKYFFKVPKVFVLLVVIIALRNYLLRSAMLKYQSPEFLHISIHFGVCVTEEFLDMHL